MNTSEIPTPPVELQQSLSWLPGSMMEACPVCKRVFLVPSVRSKQSCPICYQSELEPQPSLVRKEVPEMVAPIEIDQQNLGERLTAFLDGVPYKTDDLAVENLLKRIQVVWWPQWLVDADLEGEWSGTVGFDYQVRTAKERYGDQGWNSQSVLRTEIRYEPRMGLLKRHYDNILVPALPTDKARIQQLGAYDYNRSKNFKIGMLEQASVQMPGIEPQELQEAAENTLRHYAEKEILQAAGAQHRREINYRGAYKNLNWTQFLLPIYSSYYVDEKGLRHPVVMNAQTGRLYGRRLASIKKARNWTIGLAALPVLVFLISLLVAVFSTSNSAACVTGVAILLGFLSLIPLFRAASWNRRQEETVGQFQ